jgi:ABC-type multidrug transport system ATPase subunit
MLRAVRVSEEVLELLGLGSVSESKVRTLSGGQRRRLDVALGIINLPALLFLDEPTTGFDPEARLRFWDLIRLLASGGTTILLTTHYLEEAAALPGSDPVCQLRRDRPMEGGRRDPHRLAACLTVFRWSDKG